MDDSDVLSSNRAKRILIFLGGIARGCFTSIVSQQGNCNSEREIYYSLAHVSSCACIFIKILKDILGNELWYSVIAFFPFFNIYEL